MISAAPFFCAPSQPHIGAARVTVAPSARIAAALPELAAATGAFAACAALALGFAWAVT
jgi:hypothetical protein